MLGKTLESPLDCKEIQPVHSVGDQPWDFFGGNDAKAETPVLWPPHAKSWLIGKDFNAGRDWGQEEKGMTEDEMAGWHHWLDGRKSEWTPGVGDRQGGLACCDSWGHKKSDMTEQLNWTELLVALTALHCNHVLFPSLGSRICKVGAIHSENIIKLYLLRMNALHWHFKYSLLCRMVFKVWILRQQQHHLGTRYTCKYWNPLNIL